MQFQVNFSKTEYNIDQKNVSEIKHLDRIKSVEVNDYPVPEIYNCKIIFLDRDPYISQFNETGLLQFIKGIDPEKVINNSSVITYGRYKNKPKHKKRSDMLLDTLLK